MSTRLINGSGFYNMILSGAARLKMYEEKVNALNVFPVPDGDTGSNMSRTVQSGIDALAKEPPTSLGLAARRFSDGLLMGARGNSGVILSQLFRGFAQALENKAEADVAQLAYALQSGVQTAYSAVVKPVEGTILTVAKGAAQAAAITAETEQDVAEWLAAVCRGAESSLARTPELLPILKKAGVVDSGGQGLLYLYEGMLTALAGDLDAMPQTTTPPDNHELMQLRTDTEALSRDKKNAQAHIDSDEIDMIYDMEFFIRFAHELPAGQVADKLRSKLTTIGDSVIVIGVEQQVKVHVHTNDPGVVLTEALQYGELADIHILNMRDQHKKAAARSDDSNIETVDVHAKTDAPPQRFAMVAVAPGTGIRQIFASLGVDVVVDGGQTMNPSTEDIVEAVQQTDADIVFVLPNNSNIIMAAEQAASLSKKKLIVIPTRTVPQGMAAALAIRPEGEAEHNETEMNEAAARVKSGSITRAVRASRMDEHDIREGDYIGLLENRIVVADSGFEHVCRLLLEGMIDDEDEIITVLVGDGVDADDETMVKQIIAARFPDMDLEWHEGGQPLYPFIFAVE